MRVPLDHSRRREQLRRIALRAVLPAAIGLLITAGLALAKWERIELYRVGDEPASLAVGELTGDGINDIIVGNSLSGYASFFKSRPDGLYNLPTKLRLGRPQSAVGIGRFNKGKRRDVVATADFGNRLMVRYAKRRGFKKTKQKKTGRAPAALAVGRLDGDRYDDVVVANAGDDTITIFKGSRKGLKKSKTLKVGASAPVAVAIGDVGSGGRRDIVTANAKSRNISILLSKKRGFRKPRQIPVGPEPSDVAIGQLGKGRGSDIAVVAAGSKRFTVVFGKKQGWLVRRYTGLKNADSVDIGQIDGNRRSEIAFSSSLKSKVAIFYRGKGFRKGKVLGIPGGPTAIRIARLDFDGNPDMATANIDNFSAAIIHQR